MRVFRELLSIGICASFSVGFWGGKLVLIVLVPDVLLLVTSIGSQSYTVKSP